MDKRGSAKGVFIVFIPFFLIFFAIAIDTGISMYQNKKLKEDTEMIITDVVSRPDMHYTEYEDEITRLFERYNYQTDDLVIMVTDKTVYVENGKRYSGIFSSIFYKSHEDNQIVKKLLGVPFKISQNSKAFVKIEATYQDHKIISFEEVER